MLQFLDKLVYYQDPTLPAFSSLAYLFILVLISAFLISYRSRQLEGETTN